MCKFVGLLGIFSTENIEMAQSKKASKNTNYTFIDLSLVAGVLQKVSTRRDTKPLPT